MPVHVWALTLDQPPDVVAALAAHLDEGEARTAGARRNGVARARSVVSHGAVRELLAGAIGTEPRALRIERRCEHCGDPGHGKPVLGDVPALRFSVSHSAGVGVVAIAEGAPIGVDVEVVRSRTRLERLAERVCTPEEHRAWRAFPPDRQLIEFLHLWTAKEAYLKAIGLGVVRSLREVPSRPVGWSVRAVDAEPGTVIMVALEGNMEELRVARWTPGVSVSLESAC
jgi:4'-phosphopantetheinyl transferase